MKCVHESARQLNRKTATRRRKSRFAFLPTRRCEITRHALHVTPEIYKRDPAKVMDDMVARFIAAREAERAESVIDVTPEPEPAKPEPEEGVDGEMA